jgi:hypothetical protein
LVDWTSKGGAVGDDAGRSTEYVKFLFDSERNNRPTLALNKSPFYEDILLTVHDFHFCVWKTSLDNYEAPIFRSSNTF